MNEFKHRWSLILAAGFLPFAALVYFILRFHVNVPFGDEWEIAEYLENWDAGRMSLAYLWEQHNEHRTFFPRIILLFMAKLTQWNLLYEELLNASLAFVTYCVLASFCLRFEKWAGKFYMACFILFLPWIVLSFRQWENWSWGIQLVVFLSTFSTVAGLVLLAARPVSRGSLAAAVAFGVLSQCSFSSGLAYWPAGLAVLWFAVYAPGARRWQMLIVWCAAASLISALCLWGFNKPTHHPTLSYCLAHPIEYILYVLGFLGSLVNRGKGAFAAFMGASGITFSIIAFAALYRQNKVPRNLLAGLAALGAYAVLNALMAGLGRAGFEEEGQSLSSRYVTISYLFWVSTILFGALLFQSISERGISRTLRRVLRGSQAFIFIALVLILLRTTYTSLKPWDDRRQLLETARAQFLRSEEDEAILQAVSTLKDGNRIRDNIDYLRRRKIGLFAE
jgi:hypothetical protein